MLVDMQRTITIACPASNQWLAQEVDQAVVAAGSGGYHLGGCRVLATTACYPPLPDLPPGKPLTEGRAGNGDGALHGVDMCRSHGYLAVGHLAASLPGWLSCRLACRLADRLARLLAG